MRAVRLHDPKDLRFETIDKAADPAAAEVRIKVAFAGICGSDIHNYKTGQWITRRPSTAGHEFAGWVDAVGSDVNTVAVGDKVAADSRHYCGKCPTCLAGDYHLCENLGFVGESIDGGFADYVTLPARLVEKCKPDMRLDVAAFAEPLAVALHAINRISIGDDEPLFIIGCGPIGALVAVASSLQSSRDLFVCDLDEKRTSIVAEVTGSTVLNLTDYLSGKAAPDLSHVVDTTGHLGVIKPLIDKLSGATLGLVGIGSGKISIDPVGLVEREVSVVGCHAFTYELPEAVAMLQDHSDHFLPLIQHRIQLEDTPSEYDKICGGQASGIKTLIEINSHEATE